MDWKNVWVEREVLPCYNGIYDFMKDGYGIMQVILSNRRCAVVMLERGERCVPQELAGRLFPVGTDVEFEAYSGGVQLLFFWRRNAGGLCFASFDDLADYLTDCSDGGELWESPEGRLCILGEIKTFSAEYGTRLTAAECAWVREWGKHLGDSEKLRRVLIAEFPVL